MSRSLLTYFLFLVFASIGIIYSRYLSYSNLRAWEIQNILILLIGVPFLWLLPKAKLEFLPANNFQLRKQTTIPLLIGVLFGMLDLIVIEYILPHPIHTSLPPYTQPFPYSLFLYFSGAFEIEVFYRLIPITIILFVFNKYKEGKYFNAAFIVAAILTSIREPLEQMPTGPSWFVVYSLVSGFGMNYLQAYFFKKYSFISSLTIRLGHYLIWHILNGMMIQYFILQ